MSESKQRKYITPEQKIEIINSPLSNVELAKIYGINNKSVSQIRRRAGIHKTGTSGGAYNCKLTQEQIKEIIETTTPSSQLADKFNVCYETVWAARKRYGVVLPTKPKKKPVLLTNEQREEVANSTLEVDKLAEIYNVERTTILKIKRKAGKGIGTGKRSGGARNTKLTDEQRKEILQFKHTIPEYAAKFKVGVATISRVIHKAGVNRRPVIKVEKKPIKKRTINFKKSKMEEDAEEKVKAEKAAKVYHMTEKEKLESGLYHWVDAMPRGKVLRKIN